MILPNFLASTIDFCLLSKDNLWGYLINGYGVAQRQAIAITSLVPIVMTRQIPLLPWCTCGLVSSSSFEGHQLDQTYSFIRRKYIYVLCELVVRKRVKTPSDIRFVIILWPYTPILIFLQGCCKFQTVLSRRELCCSARLQFVNIGKDVRLWWGWLDGWPKRSLPFSTTTQTPTSSTCIMFCSSLLCKWLQVTNMW